MWPRLLKEHSCLLNPFLSSGKKFPKALVFDVGNVLIDLDWDGFYSEIENLHKKNLGDKTTKVTAQEVLAQLKSQGYLKKWSTGKMGPYEFVKVFSECMGYSFGQDHMNPIQVKRISSMIVGNVRPGVIGLLKDLRAKGYILGVLSNAVPWHETDIRRTLCLDELFDAVLFSQDFGFEKPELEFYGAAHQELSRIASIRNAKKDLILEKSDVCFVDDLPENVEAARNFGWKSSLLLLLAEPYRSSFLNGAISNEALQTVSLDPQHRVSGKRAFFELQKLFEGL